MASVEYFRELSYFTIGLTSTNEKLKKKQPEGRIPLTTPTFLKSHFVPPSLPWLLAKSHFAHALPTHLTTPTGQSTHIIPLFSPWLFTISERYLPQ